LFSKREGSAFKDVSLWGSVYAWVLFRHLTKVGQNTFNYKDMMAYFKVRPSELGLAVYKGVTYGIIDRVPGRGYVVDLDRARLYLPLLPKDIIKQSERRLGTAPEWREAYEYYTAWAELSDWSNTSDPDVPQHTLDTLNKYGIEVKEVRTPDGLRPLTAVMRTVHGTLYLILMELPKAPTLIRCVSLPPDYGTDAWLCASKKFYLYAYAPSLMP
jgi:hypothetical protein